MFGILKPAPHVERLKDPAQVKKKYRYWQLRTLTGMYIGYVVYYFARKNLPIVLPLMMEQLNLTMVDIGWILTATSLTYGFSKFTRGIISDRSNPRYFMAFGLIITGVINVIFGMSSSIIVFGILWGLNGWFQGCGWPPCSRLLTHWYGQKERGRWWAVWNTSHNLGGFLIPLIVVQAVVYFGSWRYGLWVPGAIAIVTGLFLINLLRDTPQSLGLPPVEEFKPEVKKSEEGAVAAPLKAEEELTTREILFKYVLSNPYIWLLAAAYFFLTIVRQGVSDWGVVYLQQARGLSYSKAAVVTSLFEIGGLCGSLASGWLSDIVFKGKRGPVSVLFAFLVVGAVTAFWMTGSSWLLACCAMFGVGFSIYGPQMLIGIAAAELSHKKASATATGFAGCFAYIGGAVAGGPLAMFNRQGGWDAVFAALIVSSIIVALLLIPLWSKTHRKERSAVATTG